MRWRVCPRGPSVSGDRTLGLGWGERPCRRPHRPVGPDVMAVPCPFMKSSLHSSRGGSIAVCSWGSANGMLISGSGAPAPVVRQPVVRREGGWPGCRSPYGRVAQGHMGGRDSGGCPCPWLRRRHGAAIAADIGEGCERTIALRVPTLDVPQVALAVEQVALARRRVGTDGRQGALRVPGQELCTRRSTDAAPSSRRRSNAVGDEYTLASTSAMAPHAPASAPAGSSDGMTFGAPRGARV